MSVWYHLNILSPVIPSRHSFFQTIPPYIYRFSPRYLPDPPDGIRFLQSLRSHGTFENLGKLSLPQDKDEALPLATALDIPRILSWPSTLRLKNLKTYPSALSSVSLQIFPVFNTGVLQKTTNMYPLSLTFASVLTVIDSRDICRDQLPLLYYRLCTLPTFIQFSHQGFLFADSR